MGERILIADDEADMRNLLKIALGTQGYEILEAEDGRIACAILERESVDLLILDMMMPEMDGWDVLERLDGDVPILVLSARGRVEDRVRGLNLGASDYLLKPFDIRELIARVQALLRRHQDHERHRERDKQNAKHLIHHKELCIDTLAKEVYIEEQHLDLTPKEYEVLELLALNRNQVFSREQIVERLWGFDYTGELRAVDTHVKKLRLKIRDAGGDPSWIATAWGFGYKFDGKCS